MGLGGRAVSLARRAIARRDGHTQARPNGSVATESSRTQYSNRHIEGQRQKAAPQGRRPSLP